LHGRKRRRGISGITSGCRCWGGIPGSTRDSLAGWLGNLGIDNDPENGYQDQYDYSNDNILISLLDGPVAANFFSNGGSLFWHGIYLLRIMK